jgi:hypothetical protein
LVNSDEEAEDICEELVADEKLEDTAEDGEPEPPPPLLPPQPAKNIIEIKIVEERVKCFIVVTRPPFLQLLIQSIT